MYKKQYTLTVSVLNLIITMHSKLTYWTVYRRH